MHSSWLVWMTVLVPEALELSGLTDDRTRARRLPPRFWHSFDSFRKAANRVRCRGSRRPRHQDRFTASGASSRMVEDILFRISPPREVRTPLADRRRLRLASTASEHTRGVRPAGLGVVVDTTAGDLAMLLAIAELRARHGLQVKVEERIRRQFFDAVGVNSQTMHGKVLFVRGDGSVSAGSGHLGLVL